MSNPYREIFSVPGTKGFSAAGFLARLPIAMAPIGIVAMLSQTHGEYWLGGAVSATYALTNALIAPQIVSVHAAGAVFLLGLVGAMLTTWIGSIPALRR